MAMTADSQFTGSGNTPERMESSNLMPTDGPVPQHQALADTDQWPFQTQMTDDLEKLLAILPDPIRSALIHHPDLARLVEVVMDLGRKPEARFPGRAEDLSEDPVTRYDLEATISKVGDFSSDNRAGIESTLHRISAIRNRQGSIIGLTCRVGRCVIGVVSIIQDLVEQGKSILLLGRPGVGKTTALREIARVLADDFHKRVVIIDTSNEIAGDGDVPHPGIGRARRMQVATPELQHKTMIEAVENHMPEVVVIDEIGTELEATASRTIAERGVMLVATAHGNQIENLLKNPTLSDLVGGIQSVTLGDDEARRRGSQKSVLERKAPPTFDIAVEMLERTRWVVHENVSLTVDRLLRGQEPPVQVRSLDPQGELIITRSEPAGPQWPPGGGSQGSRGWRRSGQMEALPFNPTDRREALKARPVMGGIPSGLAEVERPTGSKIARNLGLPEEDFFDPDDDGFANASYGMESGALHIYPYGVSRQHIEQVAQTLELEVEVIKNLDEADVVLALRSQVRSRSKIQQLAQVRQIPIHTVKANTLLDLTRALRRLLNLDPGGSTDMEMDLFIQAAAADESEALEEARLAVEQIVIPKSQTVELLPRPSLIRRRQHELVEHYRLRAESFGEEPNRRLRIYPEIS